MQETDNTKEKTHIKKINKKIEDKTHITNINNIKEANNTKIKHEIIQENKCSSIKDSSKIKKSIQNEIFKLEQSANRFRDKFSQLNLNNVIEKVLAKCCTVKYDKFEDWKSIFFTGLSNIGFNDEIINVIENVFKKLEN